MEQKHSSYLNFVRQGLRLARALPIRFSKYSNKMYDNHQKMVLLVLKQKTHDTYRGIIEFLIVTPSIRLLLGLRNIPHHTTLVKFAQRLNGKILSLLFAEKKASIVAVDATGFENETKSFYYRTVWNSERKWKTREYTKLSIAIDAEKQTILSYRIRRKLRHDTIDFKELLKELDVDYVVADKGYDSRENRQFVLRKMCAVPVIPVRSHSHFYGYQGSRKIDGSNYHQRSKVETVFSVMKRKYGSVLRARSFAGQEVETICKMVAHNADRMAALSLWLIRGFQQSQATKHS